MKCCNRSAFDNVAKLSIVTFSFSLVSLVPTMNLSFIFVPVFHSLGRSEVDKLLTACFYPPPEPRLAQNIILCEKFHLRLWGNRNNTISLNKDRSLDFFFLLSSPLHAKCHFHSMSIDTKLTTTKNGRKVERENKN
jgi:hypothetical protein